MSDLASAIAAQQRAADAFAAAARAVPDATWNVPRAPGKWSPAQVTDHVGVATKIGRGAVTGTVNMGSLPRFLRPIAGALFFKPVLRRGFPKKSMGPAIMAPAHEPMDRETLIARLQEEVGGAARDALEMAANGATHFDHTFFGKVSLADYIMFNALHLDHHREQLPAT